MANIKPWDARLAAFLVRPLANTRVTANHITTASLLLAMAGVWLFAAGDQRSANVGATLFILARFIDHMDGELARMTGSASAFGHWYDYVVGGISYAALFLALGFAMSDGLIGGLAPFAGAFVAGFVLLNMGLRMRMDRMHGSEAVGYPHKYGFELEDGIYLLGPITWIGAIEYFFIVGCAGTLMFAFFTLATFLHRRRHWPTR